MIQNYDSEIERRYHPENMVDNLQISVYDNFMPSSDPHYITKYRKTLKGLIHHSLQRQKKRKHGVLYSDYDFIMWCLKNRKLNRLYLLWRENDYRRDLRPTIDRINPLKSYSLDNIQILTYAENVRKGNGELRKTKGKKIIQYDLGGKEVERFNSIIEAQEKTGFLASNICNALKGRLKTYKMFVWKYQKRLKDEGYAGQKDYEESEEIK